jgi:WD40 repeat protein
MSSVDEDEEINNYAPSSKRHRHDNRIESNQVALYAPPLEDDDYLQHNDIRTSSLAEPTMKLSGHKGSVYCLSYDPQGEILCSGSFDSKCLLWKGEFPCLPCILSAHMYHDRCF